MIKAYLMIVNNFLFVLEEKNENIIGNKKIILI